MTNVDLYVVVGGVLLVMLVGEHRQARPVDPSRRAPYAAAARGRGVSPSIGGSALIGLTFLALALLAPAVWRLLP